MTTRNWLSIGAAVAVLAVTAPSAARAQDAGYTPAPEMDFVMGGMGAFNYMANTEGMSMSNFGAKLAPILLWNMGSDFLFESHLEFELEDGATNTHLEYAQVDYVGLDHVQFVVGKFLLPFGVFGQRLHPVWINRMATFPLLYADAETLGADGAVLQVASDIGVMAEVSAPISDRWNVNASAYVTNGPSLVEAEDAGGTPEEFPSVGIGSNFADNNTNKMIGGRLGVVGADGLEFYVSALHGAYDDAGDLFLNGFDVAGWWDHGPYRVRAEWATIGQQFQGAEAVETLHIPGYYIQGSRRFGKVDAVVRWSQNADRTVAGETVETGTRQIAEGLDYWFHPSVVGKVTYEQNLDGTDRLVAQAGFGF